MLSHMRASSKFNIFVNQSFDIIKTDFLLNSLFIQKYLHRIYRLKNVLIYILNVKYANLIVKFRKLIVHCHYYMICLYCILYFSYHIFLYIIHYIFLL